MRPTKTHGKQHAQQPASQPATHDGHKMHQINKKKINREEKLHDRHRKAFI
jgi:hypothetical protein